MKLQEKRYWEVSVGDEDKFSPPPESGFLLNRKELVQLLTLARMFQGPIDSFLKKEGIKYLD